MSKTGIASALAVAAVLAGPIVLYAAQGESEAALARALGRVRLPLEHGIAASALEGVPISAKYELDDDQLQLSVYIVKDDPSDAISVDFDTGDVWLKDGAFTEVIVDPGTGKVGKIVPIRDGEDLAHARSQSTVMALAKRSLESATASAVSDNRGFRAVSAMPEVQDGRPIVKVGLTDGRTRKTVVERLDREGP